MKKFETSWRNTYEYFERYYDDETNQSKVSKIDLPHEWYEPSYNGLYSSILDENKLFDKKQGKSKDGHGKDGFLDPIYRNIRDQYWNKNGYNLNPSIFYLDIETRVGQNSTGFPVPQKALEEISLIQIYHNKTDTVIMLGLRDWVHQDSFKLDYKTKYINCKNEVTLIKTFISIFNKLDPLIIYAWNGMGFDFPYLYNRLKKLGFDKNSLSNYGNVKYSENEHEGRISFKFEADGHYFIDLMEVYKKFELSPRSSYALDAISELELGERKVQHTEYETFDGFYTGDYIIPQNPTDEQLNSTIYKEAIKNGITQEVKELAHSEFCYYGYKDPILIKLIDERKNFTSLMLMITEKMGVKLSDALGTVKPWSQFISNTSNEQMKVLPAQQDHDHPNIVGGYVREPEIGKHKWCLSADVNSMYPLLGMVGFNMSPETFIPKNELPEDLRDIILKYFNDQDEGKRLELSDDILEETKRLLKKYDMSLGINGAIFTRKKIGMVPEMVKNIYVTRKEAKKTMFNYERQSILINHILEEKLAGNVEGKVE